MLVRSDKSTPDNVLYDGKDNKTGEVVATGLTMNVALRINKLYNKIGLCIIEYLKHLKRFFGCFF